MRAYVRGARNSADPLTVRVPPLTSEPMSSPDSHVKFDRNGVSYVDYDDLRNSPKVQRQIEAARRIMDRQQATVHSLASHTATTASARKSRR